jgi:hypothetical protein
MSKLTLSRRSLLSAGVAHGALALAAVPLSGCFGSFSLTHKVWQLNDSVSDSKWVKWVLFLAFVIVPIYGISIFVDAIVLNTIEFFTGSNPMRAKLENLPGGHALAFERVNESRVRVVHTKDGATVRVLYIEIDGTSEARVLDEGQRTVFALRDDGDGARLVTGDGARLDALDAATLSEAYTRVSGGASPSDAALAALERARASTPQVRARL